MVIRKTNSLTFKAVGDEIIEQVTSRALSVFADAQTIPSSSLFIFSTDRPAWASVGTEQQTFT